MCGIIGVINLNKKSNSINQIISMIRMIDHRGPDDEGFVLINSNNKSIDIRSGEKSCEETKNKFPLINNNSELTETDIVLGHKRFSIIELSSAGFQPLIDENKQCIIVFNGEIYNYIEIREELKSFGINFFSNSDTEVLLKAYIHWGINCFEKFNGFWALLIYDFRTNKLLVSRDRLGKKPLYWYKNNNTIYFASEIKSILQIKNKYTPKLNESVITNWLRDGIKDYSNETFFSDIFSFPQASFSYVNEDFPNNIKNFWSIKNERMNEKEISIKDATHSIRNLLEDAVKIRLRADVPWCVELSGGMDSSALVGLASQLSNKKIKTYTVKFTEKKWDEEPFAKKIADKFNVDYNILLNPEENFWSKLNPFTFLEEEPYHSPNLETNQMIWAAMRNEGIKVSLNGAAGDELFAGYGNYFNHIQLENLDNFNFNYFFKNLNWTETNSKIKAFISPFMYLAEIKYKIKFPKKFRRNYVSNNFLKSNYSSQDFTEFSLSNVLYNDLNFTKIPYWLRSGDKGYMGVPLEVRAPFLDYRLVDLVSSLPVTYLIRNGWHKWILRKSLEDLLPEDVLWRKNKMGFPFPYEAFVQNNHEIFNLIINNSDNPYLNYNLKNEFSKNWKIISFILWYEYFINNNINLFNKINKTIKNKTYLSPFKPLYQNTFEGMDKWN